MSDEHPIKQEISSVSVSEFESGGEFHQVGQNGVTKIEATVKSGMYSNIPYVVVWKGESAFAEYCQHNIVAVYFKERAA